MLKLQQVIFTTPHPKGIELLPCDWLISNLCYQAIEQVYLIKWPVSVCVYVRLAGCTAKFSETPLETAYCREINIQFTATALVDIPAVSMPIACSLKTCNIRTLCCVIKLHILEWPFIVASLRPTCAIIMLSNQHLDMPHLWGGWIISAKEKCSLIQI